MIKVYNIGGDLCGSVFNIELVDHPSKADMIVYHGGVDISSSIYEEKPGKHNQRSVLERDLREINIFAQYPNAFKLGICRGAQLLTALSGGRLIQHVNNHHQDHDIHCVVGEEWETMRVSSCHHQMMYPFEMDNRDYSILAFSDNRSTTYLDGNNEELINESHNNELGFFEEPEVVWYPKTRSLCVQGHPEWMTPQDPFIHYLNDIIKKLYNEKENN